MLVSRLIPDTTSSAAAAASIQQNRILEPILEEDSDEDDQARWSLQSYETNASTSSSSGSGDSCESVVQLAEVNFLPGGLLRNPVDDTDTVSERDYLCPPKRRKHELSTLFADSFTPANCLKLNPHKIRFDSLEPDYHKKRYRNTHAMPLKPPGYS